MSIYPNLATKLDTNNPLTGDMVGMWNSVVLDILTSGVTNTVNIDIVTAEKYRFDFDGLLRSIGVAREHMYPHVRVNGLYSSGDYDGMSVSIVTIDTAVLVQYVQHFYKK